MCVKKRFDRFLQIGRIIPLDKEWSALHRSVEFKLNDTHSFGMYTLSSSAIYMTGHLRTAFCVTGSNCFCPSRHLPEKYQTSVNLHYVHSMVYVLTECLHRQNYKAKCRHFGPSSLHICKHKYRIERNAIFLDKLYTLRAATSCDKVRQWLYRVSSLFAYRVPFVPMVYTVFQPGGITITHAKYNHRPNACMTTLHQVTFKNRSKVRCCINDHDNH